MSKEAMKLALEALGNSWTEPGNKQYEFEKEAITALREALAEQPAQQEPVAWTNWRELVGARHYRTPGWEMYADKRNPDDVAIYTSPPAQRTWVGLTDDDVRQCSRDVVAGGKENSVDRFAYAIEAKLRSKNEDRN